MKTFKDLEFKPKNTMFGGFFARLYFPNGYGVSVISGYGSYTTGERPYELAVLKDNGLCYDSGITDDVLAELTPEDVTKYMIKIQRL